MISRGNEKVVDYFLDEIQAIRTRASAFAEDYPDVASELRLGSGHSDDPHVEMLLQAFSYMTARLRYNLDAELPQVPSNIFKYLYPHLETPIPSMAVLQVSPRADVKGFTEPFRLERGRQFKRKVKSQDNQKHECFMKTAYETQLWPIEVEDLSLLPAEEFESIEQRFRNNSRRVRSVLKLRLKTLNDVSFDKLELDRLRLFINPSNQRAYDLFDHLHSNLISVVTSVQYEDIEQVQPEIDLSQTIDSAIKNNFDVKGFSENLESILGKDKQPRQTVEQFHEASLSWQGFAQEQAILPYTASSHPGYRLIQEYFLFPEKFLFFDVHDIQCDGDHLDLYFLFDVDLSNRRLIDKDSLMTNCIPSINLYDLVSEPVRVNHKEYEYLLIPDVRQYRTCEIHSIDKVIGVDEQGNAKQIPAFLPTTDGLNLETEDCYWSSRRDYTDGERFPGTETFLSFHDPSFHISQPSSQSLFAHVSCTNRDLVEHLRIGNQMRLIGEGPTDLVVVASKPTPYREPALRGRQPWDLIAHLTLNFSTLCDESNNSIRETGNTDAQDEQTQDERDQTRSKSQNAVTLQNLLRQYCDVNNVAHQRLIDAIIDVSTEQELTHMGEDAWRGFYRGLSMSVHMDANRLHGCKTSILLFGEIVQRFLALFISVGSFVRLKLFSNQQTEAIKIWPAMMGEQELI